MKGMTRITRGTATMPAMMRAVTGRGMRSSTVWSLRWGTRRIDPWSAGRLPLPNPTWLSDRGSLSVASTMAAAATLTVVVQLLPPRELPAPVELPLLPRHHHTPPGCCQSTRGRARVAGSLSAPWAASQSGTPSRRSCARQPCCPPPTALAPRTHSRRRPPLSRSWPTHCSARRPHPLLLLPRRHRHRCRWRSRCSVTNPRQRCLAASARRRRCARVSWGGCSCRSTRCSRGQ